MIDLLIIGGIIGYGAYVTVGYFKKTKKGKCASCSVEKNCMSENC